MGCLKKDEILASNDIKMEKVFVPEWADGDPEAYVMVKSLLGSEQDEFDRLVTESIDGEKPKIDMTDYRAKRAVFCLCDDDGNRLFGIEDVSGLSNKSAKALQRIMTVDQKLNGTVEEVRKNSE